MRTVVIHLPIQLLLQTCIRPSHASILPERQQEILSYENMNLTGDITTSLNTANHIWPETNVVVTGLEGAKKCGKEVFHSMKSWWFYALELGHNATEYATKIIDEFNNSTIDAAHEIAEFKENIENIVKMTSTFRQDFSSGEITLSDISSKLGTELQVVFEELKEEFGDTRPNVPVDEREKERETIIDKILDKVEAVLIKVLTEVNVQEPIARARFHEIKPVIKKFLQVSGRLIDKHPLIVETVLVSATFFIVPEAWFLRPILSLFGFGPYGPVKGSAAAWAQRRFWGGAVTKGSWFSHLQRAGMKLPSSWLLSALAGSAVALGVAGSACSCMEWWFGS